MKTRALATLALALLMACTPTSTKFSRADVAARAQTEMIGFSQSQVLSCMGPPVARAGDRRLEVWSYASGGDRQAVAYVNPMLNSYVVTGQSQVRSCVVNVEFRSGLVSKVSYLGRTGGLITQGEQCAFAVANCVSAN